MLTSLLFGIYVIYIKMVRKPQKTFFIGVGIVVGFEIILLLIFALVEVIA